MPHPRPPDWQLPPGVTPGLWEYLHDPVLAQQYLSKVSESPFAIADRRFVEKHLPVPCRVIDLGCGPGRSLAPLVQRGFQCTGLDLSEPMLEEARKTLSLAQHGQDGAGYQLIQANLGERLPFGEGSFDAALCLFGTLGMLHPEVVRSGLLTEVKRILTPQGKFLVHVHNRWPLQGITTLFKKSSVVTLPVHQGISNLQMKLYTEREIRTTLASAGLIVTDLAYIDARHPQGQYTGSRWLAPFRSAGFLLAASPTP